MFCAKCGKELHEEVKYCIQCGADLSKTNSAYEDFFYDNRDDRFNKDVKTVESDNPMLKATGKLSRFVKTIHSKMLYLIIALITEMMVGILICALLIVFSISRGHFDSIFHITLVGVAIIIVSVIRIILAACKQRTR